MNRKHPINPIMAVLTGFGRFFKNPQVRAKPLTRFHGGSFYWGDTSIANVNSPAIPLKSLTWMR
jgi:hypothetical protein